MTTDPKMDALVASLLSEEMRRKSMDDNCKDALYVRGRSKEKGGDKKRWGGSKSKGRSKTPGKSRLRCWECGKRGHLKKDCRHRKKKIEDSSTEKSSDNEVIDALFISEEWLQIDQRKLGARKGHKVWNLV
eukprot:Gb_16694 [translate_table: standard]